MFYIMASLWTLSLYASVIAQHFAIAGVYYYKVTTDARRQIGIVVILGQLTYAISVTSYIDE